MNPQYAYVDAAISAMRLAQSHDDLVRWWIDEKPNREKWRLSPNQVPGLNLKEAFELEGPSHGYATSIVCHSCGEYVDAQENPLLKAYMNGRADVLNEQSVGSVS